VHTLALLHRAYHRPGLVAAAHICQALCLLRPEAGWRQAVSVAVLKDVVDVEGAQLHRYLCHELLTPGGKWIQGRV
jgi:hypothetical protein